MSSSDKPYTVTIKWGKDYDSGVREVFSKTTYAFETPLELGAFLEGVEEGCGWLEYDIVEEEP